MPIRILIPDWRTVVASVLIVFAFPPWGFSALIWIALAPWIAALERAEKGEHPWLKSMSEAMWLSLFMTVGGFYWIAYAVSQFGNLPTWVGVAALVLHGLGAQSQFILFAPLYVWTLRKYGRGALPAFALSAAYVAIDWAFPKLFADTLGHALFDWPRLRQVADIGGPMLLTFLVILCNLAVWTAFVRIRDRNEPSARPALRALAPQLGMTLTLLIACGIYGALRLAQVRRAMAQPIRTIQLAVIQANTGDFEKLAAERGVRAAADSVLETYFKLSDRALALTPKPEALIWPETAYPSTFRTPQTSSEFARDKALERFVRDRGVPLLFGGYDRAGDRDFNAFFFLSPRLGTYGESDQQIYRKNVLLLFGEYIPGLDSFPAFRAMFPQIGQFGRGPGPEALEIPPMPGKPLTLAGPSICYEALFPDHARGAVRKGAEVLINITNDSWFGAWGEPQLHFALSTFRSVETRRSFVRATNSGISALVYPDGEIGPRTGVYTEEVFNVTVPILAPMKTLALAWGDWFDPFCLMSGIFGFIILRLRKKPFSVH